MLKSKRRSWFSLPDSTGWERPLLWTDILSLCSSLPFSLLLHSLHSLTLLYICEQELYYSIQGHHRSWLPYQRDWGWENYGHAAGKCSPFQRNGILYSDEYFRFGTQQVKSDSKWVAISRRGLCLSWPVWTVSGQFLLPWCRLLYFSVWSFYPENFWTLAKLEKRVSCASEYCRSILLSLRSDREQVWSLPGGRKKEGRRMAWIHARQHSLLWDVC